MSTEALPRMQLAGRPDRPEPPPQYERSYAHLGVRAQHGRLIEIRAPLPEAREWPRIYLDAHAAEKLLEWLPHALAFALGGRTEA